MSHEKSPQNTKDVRYTLADLLNIMRDLRTPGTGCPWDTQQSFRTIAPYTIEEAYEVADAIAREDLCDLKEELGDLLFQVVYHAQLAHEVDAFEFADVVHAIADKMVRRHPHVFGDPEVYACVDVKGLWDRIKGEERAAKAARNRNRDRPIENLDKEGWRATPTQAGLLDDVPVAFPSLTRAIKLQRRAAKAGFDWPNLRPVLAKMHEELAELHDALATGSQDSIEDELGDVLFVVANVARHIGVDPEAALHRTNQKFTQRWKAMEERLATRERSPTELTLQELDQLWDAAKVDEP